MRNMHALAVLSFDYGLLCIYLHRILFRIPAKYSLTSELRIVWSRWKRYFLSCKGRLWGLTVNPEYLDEIMKESEFKAYQKNPWVLATSTVYNIDLNSKQDWTVYLIRAFFRQTVSWPLRLPAKKRRRGGGTSRLKYSMSDQHMWFFSCRLALWPPRRWPAAVAPRTRSTATRSMKETR